MLVKWQHKTTYLISIFNYYTTYFIIIQANKTKICIFLQKFRGHYQNIISKQYQSECRGEYYSPADLGEISSMALQRIFYNYEFLYRKIVGARAITNRPYNKGLHQCTANFILNGDNL